MLHNTQYNRLTGFVKNDSIKKYYTGVITDTAEVKVIPETPDRYKFH